MQPQIRRSRSNVTVPMDSYTSSVRAWLASPPVVPVTTKCGASLAKHYRNVTPAMLIGALPLINGLIDSGLKTAVIQTSKMEQALRIELSANVICRGPAEDLEVLVHGVATHVQHLMAMLRYLKAEDSAPAGPGGQRRYPKSGGFRRRMTLEDWASMRPVLDMLSVSLQAPLRETIV